MAKKTKSSKPSVPRRRLGRGLGSLISTPVRVETASEPAPVAGGEVWPFQPAPDAAADVVMLDIRQVKPNPRQPRQRFEDSTLQSLADSIKTAGLMQPVVVRPAAAGGYELIAGERRWRAAEIAGLDRIPAVVRTADDQTAAQWSLIENLQREDLNPIERGEAFQQLVDDFGLGHQEIAETVGLERSSVTNHLRLLGLEESIRDAIADGRLTGGHGKALLAITNIEVRSSLASQAVRQCWSVRELERRVRVAERGPASSPSPRQRSIHPHMADLERRLGEHLGTKVHITPGRKKGAGRLTIEFYDLDQFEGLMGRLQFTHD
ncbi:MAG: ParB/RepB/Spo0J family partition protein [Phycisphaerales bacterium]|nr:MAG: ParB/RepB/Spo0J family partition protein [Phycisphaerales bacterium]